MADKSIGDLPKAAALYDNDRMVLEQNGEAKHMEGRLLKDYVEPYASAAQSALEGVREAIENIPEGAATPIVNDLTTGGTSMALSAEMGKMLGQRPNPNLLDNWYFGNPVNQRGQTEYRALGYTIDRWKNNSLGSMIVGKNGITFSTDSGGYSTWDSVLGLDVIGKSITVSALTTDGKLFSNTQTVTATAVIQANLGADGFVALVVNGSTTFFRIRAHAGKSFALLAVKLELGTQQTLAHQDASGNWVLNEIPDYNEQLLRCCMSTADSSDTYANNKLTAAAVNAVSLDGSKSMTGDLTVKKASPAVVVHDTSTEVVGKFMSGDNAILMTIRNNATTANTRRQLNLYNSNSRSNIANALVLYGIKDGVQGEYNVLHTGNKPSGSYTGNGSSAYRSVTLGGIGRLCLITRGGNHWALVSARGAIISDGSSVIAVNNTIFDGACNLQLNTSHAALNENGITYTYQVL